MNEKQDFPVGPVIWMSPSNGGVSVWSLGGELRSHMPLCQKKKKKEQNIKQSNTAQIR